MSQHFTATGAFSDNSTQTLASAYWSSSASAFGTVTSDVGNYGTASGVAQGSATVSACTGTVCGSTTLTVASPTSAPPVIQGLAPGSGSAGSWVAISGAYYGAATGSSTVTFGGTAATVVNWSDTAIFVAVPAGLNPGQTVSVVVTTTAGSSNAADFVPLSSTTPAPYRVSPQEVNLLVGQTRTISVTDGSGNAVTGLEWTTSNASVASLSTDDPPVITAVAPGTAIVYVVGMPILVTVYSGTSLPAGTPIWSVPIKVSGGLGSMAPAVPSSSGVDLFAIDVSGGVGTLYALRSDGSTVWKSLPNGPWGPVVMPSGDSLAPAQVIPDFSGNAIVRAPSTGIDSQNRIYYTHTVNTIDATTGQAKVIYTFSTSCGGGFCTENEGPKTVIPHPAGLLFIQDNGSINLLDPSTGQQIAGTATGGSVGQMIVAGDGNAYIP